MVRHDSWPANTPAPPCHCVSTKATLTRMKAESANLTEFLQATPVLDCDTPAVRERACEIASGRSGDVERAKALFEWVRDATPHSWDIQSRKVTCTASEVLAEGTGICFAKSHLLAAMLRSVGIPAGLYYQRLRRDPEYDGFTLHGLNALYLDSHSKWVRVDPRGNIPGVDAQFSVDEERLAWPSNAKASEFIYETIFLDADPAIVGFLSDNDDLLASWGDLPHELRFER